MATSGAKFSSGTESTDASSITSSAVTSMATLETLRFDNVALKTLPIDAEKKNFLREVEGACFSRVNPTPVVNPRLVAVSAPAMRLIGLGEQQILRPEFVKYFSGNKLLPGSETAAHCYCGHQFGYFAGQLGDGAAIYLGEVINGSKERWEVQLKGAGLTPFSRQADGRKVLRSSIREFLCSEAMHHLGIATTRAGCCITSESSVIRDIFYTGKPIKEYCSIVTRIAPTFIRFGSFEVCKGPDRESGMAGPSCTHPEVMKTLADYVIKQFYPEIWTSNQEKANEMYAAFFKAVVEKTAVLVAGWQCVGFCHGVLNTDNMSIMGLTIDYGPFGFMDRFNRVHICNTSDDGGRYAYDKQPEICKWNCLKLAEMLQKIVPMDLLTPSLDQFDKIYEKSYMTQMRKKFGFLRGHEDVNKDKVLIETFHDAMQQSGSDFTNSFRCLSRLSLPGSPDHETRKTEVLDYLLTQCSTVEELKAAYAPKMDPRELSMMMSLLQTNPQLLASLGKGYRMMTLELRNIERLKELEKESESDRISANRALWTNWIDTYVECLRKDITPAVNDLSVANKERADIMNASNPRFILRNYIAQTAIEAAEKGDYSEVQNVLKLLENPFSDASEAFLKTCPVKAGSKQESDEADQAKQGYCKKPPIWASSLKVSCSS